MRRVLLSLAVFPLLVAACGGGGDEPAGAPGVEGSPEAALAEFLAMIDGKDWGREWESLHPEQQKLVARDKFVSCLEGADSPGIGSLKVLEVHDQDILIPGTGQRAPTKAMVAEYELSTQFRKSRASDTFYLFDVDGRWRWVLSNAHMESYKAGACPA